MLLATFGSVMLRILYVIIAIVVLLTMVLIHELGHYVAGRCLGFKIEEFSIGFGKALWQKRNKRGELISLRIFPLGGYCAFYGENGEEEVDNDDVKENEPAKDKQSNVVVVEENKTDNENITSMPREKMFNDHSPWKRIIVFLAGVTFNFLSAFIFAILFLCVGGYDGYFISPSEGYTVQLYSVETQAEIGLLESETPVLAVNGKRINYATNNVFDKLTQSDDTSVTLTILVDGEEQDVYIKKDKTQETTDSNGATVTIDIYGITYKPHNFNYNFWCVLRDFIPFTFRISVVILQAFWMIITGAVALNQLGGPISTITQISSVASLGMANFLYLLPLLAANLAIFNILPIPGLDGAHVVFTLIEAIRKKPIKREVENLIHAWGIILLFAFVIIIDVVHLITA